MAKRRISKKKAGYAIGFRLLTDHKTHVIGVVILLSLILSVLLLVKPPNAPVSYRDAVTRYDSMSFERPKEIPTSTPSARQTEPIKIPVIMYHYVEYVRDQNDLIRKKLNTNPREFEGHLIALKKAGYETYFVKDVPDILNGVVSYSTRSAILTFDDGYRDFYFNVFPLLRKYHMRATVYIIHNYIGRKDFLTHDEIQEIADSGLVEIGSHTLTHRYLKTATMSDIHKEIFDSKKKLEDEFHISIKTFAYPNGAMNASAVQAVKDAGYTAAVSVIPGLLQSEDNLYLLSRLRPGTFTADTMISVIEKMKR